MSERPFTWYEIPPATKPTECRGSSCGAMIYKIDSPKTPGAKIPISVDVEGAFHPTSTEKGKGISHFLDCADVDEFRKPKRGAR